MWNWNSLLNQAMTKLIDIRKCFRRIYLLEEKKKKCIPFVQALMVFFSQIL